MANIDFYIEIKAKITAKKKEVYDHKKLIFKLKDRLLKYNLKLQDTEEKWVDELKIISDNPTLYELQKFEEKKKLNQMFKKKVEDIKVDTMNLNKMIQEHQKCNKVLEDELKKLSDEKTLRRKQDIYDLNEKSILKKKEFHNAEYQIFDLESIFNKKIKEFDEDDVLNSTLRQMKINEETKNFKITDQQIKMQAADLKREINNYQDQLCKLKKISK